MSTSLTMKMSSAVDAGFQRACADFSITVVEQLASVYSFDVNEALRKLDLEHTSVVRSSKSKVKSVRTAKAKRVIPSMVLPFCGKVNEEWCQGIRMNHGLYTQCTMTGIETDACDHKLCNTCLKQAEKNASGKPNYGVMADRTAVGAMEYSDPKGKQVVPYANVMEKLNLTREAAETEATKFDWTIPEDQFEVKKVNRGRPKKDASVSDTESESDEAKKSKKRGRPKKDKKVVKNANTGDDLIASLVAQAQADSDSEPEAKPIETIKKTKKTKKVKKVKLAKLPSAEELAKKEAAANAKVEREAAKVVKQEAAEKLKAEREAEKLVKQEAAEKLKAEREATKLAKEAEKLVKQEAAEKLKAEREATKLAKEAEKLVKQEAAAKLKAEKATQKAIDDAEKLAKQVIGDTEKLAKKEAAANRKAEKFAKQEAAEKLKAEKLKAEEAAKAQQLADELVEEPIENDDADDDNSDDEEDTVDVSKFEFEGKTYLKSTDNVLYDIKTQEPVGMWNDETNSIDEVEFDDAEDEFFSE